MNKMRSVIVAILGGAFILIGMSCSQPVDTSTEKKDSITIEQVTINTLPNDWWSNPDSIEKDPFLLFDMYFSLSDTLTEETIEKIVIQINDMSWDISFSKYFNKTKKMIIVENLCSLKNLNELQIGNSRVIITKKDGAEVYKGFIIGTINSPLTNGKKWVYHPHKIIPEDTAISSPALSIGQIVNSTKSQNELCINFTTSDSNTKNGYIWFYTGSGAEIKYIGVSPYLVSLNNSTKNENFNNGNEFSFTDTNSFIVHKNEIAYTNKTKSEETEFNKITSFRLVLHDKFQVFDNNDNISCRYKSVTENSQF